MAESKTVLVADDDPDILAFCQTTLEAGGYTVVTASDGASAIAAAQAHKPDVIVLDIMMEEPDAGFAVAEKLGKDTPILMLSSIAAAADQVFDTSSLPISDLVDKPIEPRVLLEKVAGLLGRTGA